MRCDEFEIRLQQRLDERRLPQGDSVLVAHAARCAQCGESLAAYEALFDALSTNALVDPGSDLTDGVIHQWQSSAPPKRRRANTRLLALAASLLIAALPVWWWSTREADSPARETHVATSQPKMNSAEPAAPKPDEALSLARDGLAQALTWLPLQEDMVANAGEMQDPRLRKVTQLALGMEPVAISAGRSVVALIRAIPLAEQPQLMQ